LTSYRRYGHFTPRVLDIFSPFHLLYVLGAQVPLLLLVLGFLWVGRVGSNQSLRFLFIGGGLFEGKRGKSEVFFFFFPIFDIFFYHFALHLLLSFFFF
jgi:hypothetical protein